MAGVPKQTEPRTRGATVAWTVALLCWVAFIWGNSLVPGSESGSRSTWVAQVLVPLFSGFGMTDVSAIDHVIRKVAHFLEYALLGALSIVDLGRSRRWPVVALGAIVPSVDETIQLFVPGRSGQVTDVVLDMAGFSAGVGIVLVVRTIRSRR